MGRLERSFAEILGVRGWIVKEAFLEGRCGERYCLGDGAHMMPGLRLVLVLRRTWAARCGGCGAICKTVHEKLPARRWADLPWAGRPAQIEAALDRVKCRRCGGGRVEMTAWADPRQRQTRRLQQHLALECASAPVLHVSAKHGLGWGTVRRAEEAALRRWDSTRKTVPLVRVGMDEKFLGRRNKLEDKFVTIVSNLDTGEPLWIGFGRRKETVAKWLATLDVEEKRRIQLCAMDMHDPFLDAVRGDEALAHVALVHDTFHVVKRVGQALDELRREAFFRAGKQMRAIGRGTRWLVLRAWERCTNDEQAKLRELFSHNHRLARAYQMKEELREALRFAPDRVSMEISLHRALRRTQARAVVPLRKLHDSIRDHWNEILAIAEHRPPTGRIEALNNNWETLVRRGRGYRDHAYLLLKLRFAIANPVRSGDAVRRFLALDLAPPLAHAA